MQLKTFDELDAEQQFVYRMGWHDARHGSAIVIEMDSDGKYPSWFYDWIKSIPRVYDGKEAIEALVNLAAR